MTHLQQRLAERNIKISDSTLESLARDCQQDTAIIIKRLSCNMGVNSGDYYQRTQSNGDIVVLIVRGSKPVTIMYRRSNQPMTTRDLRVNRIMDVSSRM